jgi:hypothetical protein
VTVPGTVTELVELESVTGVPPIAAGPLRVTVAVEFVPPTTVVGAKPIDIKLTGLIESDADWFIPLSVPKMTAVVLTLTPVVETVKFADEAPWGTVTVGGTVAAATLLVSETTMPPGPAGPLKFAVPVDGDPP